MIGDKNEKKNKNLDDLEVDTSILEIEEPDFDEAIKITSKNQTLPRHLMRRSLKQEQDTWNYKILVSAKKTLALKLGAKKAAETKRTRLYHARTFLMEMNRLREDSSFDDPLADWSLGIEQRDGIYYIVARNLKVELDDWKEED